jgi:hypothetical protein
MQETIKIERIHRTCSGCGKEFAYGEEIVSTVRQIEEQLARQDYCLACWKREPPTDAFSYWRGIFPVKSKPDIEDMEKVQKFFDRLLLKEETTPEIDGVKFFTALVLARKKRLKLLGTRRQEERAFLQVEKGWDGEKAEIPDPGITEEQIETIRRNMETLFEMELSLGGN